MNIKNKDLELLIEIENFLGFIKSDKYPTKINDLLEDLWGLNERLINSKEKYNKKNYERIKEKRKTNKNYARKKIERIGGKYGRVNM